jgi:hypothetical protein
MRANGRSIKLKCVVLIALFSIAIGSPVWAQTPQLPRLPQPAPPTGQSDSLLNGALIGAGVGVASGLFLCTRMEPWRNCRDDVGPMLKMGAIGAGVGIAIDALIRKRKPVNQGSPDSTRVYAAPVISRDTRGVQISLSF